MGVWNSHTSVGNILGSLIAGYWVSTCWGLSFIVPGAVVATMGLVCFLFLIERKYQQVRAPPRGSLWGLLLRPVHLRCPAHLLGGRLAPSGPGFPNEPPTPGLAGCPAVS